MGKNVKASACCGTRIPTSIAKHFKEERKLNCLGRRQENLDKSQSNSDSMHIE